MTGARDLPVCASQPKLTRDHAEWLADKIGALGDYAKEAAWMLRQWPETSKLQAENDKLRAGYAEAIDDIESWGAYASEYFQEKHDLAGTIAKHCETLDGDAT